MRPYRWLAEYYDKLFTFHLPWFEAARRREKGWTDVQWFIREGRRWRRRHRAAGHAGALNTGSRRA